MRVRLLRAFGPYRRGGVIAPPDGLAGELIRRGIAEAVESPSSTAEPPQRKSEQTADRPKSKRPR